MECIKTTYYLTSLYPGRPRCYTIFNSRNQPHHHPHNTMGGGGGQGFNFLPFGRGRTYRHMAQVFILVMVFCTVVLCQISLMTIQSAPSGNAVGSGSDSENANSIADVVPFSNFNPKTKNKISSDRIIVGTGNSQLVQAPDFAQEASGSNYLYSDDSYNDNQDEETTNSGNDNMNSNTITNNNINATTDLKKSSSGIVKTKYGRRRTNKLRDDSHYQKRKKLLESVFLSVKTTKRFHSTRLEPILNTWFNLAKEQTWIFTDADDPVLDRRTNGHIINTHCPSTHYRQALCCKMSAEFDTFIQSQKSWFCHFDDDNYVNVPALLDLLSRYDHKEYWYLGKPSLKSPIHFLDPDNKSEEVSFWFGTGGAGFCLSRALALRMSPLASGGKFTKLCDKIQLPDDVTIGYVAGHLLGQNLTVIPQFHSHFETMKFIDMKNPHSEITFSYVRYAEHVNILDVKGFFTEDEDPTRFLSLHCRLFPNFSFCPKGSSTSKR